MTLFLPIHLLVKLGDSLSKLSILGANDSHNLPYRGRSWMLMVAGRAIESQKESWSWRANDDSGSVETSSRFLLRC